MKVLDAEASEEGHQINKLTLLGVVSNLHNPVIRSILCTHRGVAGAPLKILPTGVIFPLTRRVWTPSSTARLV